MVRAILEKMKPAELRKYISAHNKVVRQYIGVEIKQARAAYSEKLKVKRRELKAAQTIDAKGKKKAELIELIMKEPTLVRKIKFDDENKSVDPPAPPLKKEKKKEEVKKEEKTENKTPDLKKILKEKGLKFKRYNKEVQVFYDKETGKTSPFVKSVKIIDNGTAMILKGQNRVGGPIKSYVLSLNKLGEKVKKRTRAEIDEELKKKQESFKGSEKQIGKKKEKKPEAKKISEERLNRLRKKVRELGKSEVAKKIKLADEIEKVAKELKLQKARAGKKPATEAKPPAPKPSEKPKQSKYKYLNINRSNLSIDYEEDEELTIIYNDPENNVLIFFTSYEEDLYEGELYLNQMKSQNNPNKPRAPKGLTRLLLCELIEYLIDKFYIDPNWTITLKTGDIGGTSTKRHDIGALENMYKKMGFEKSISTGKFKISIDDFLKWCKGHFKKIEEGETKPAPKPKAKAPAQEKKSPTAEDIKKAALAAAEEEETDDDESPDPPISAVPKRLHRVWKNYMEERVGDYYSAADQKEEIDDFKSAEKDYLQNEKIRGDTSVSASKQASARNANARTRKSMDDEFKTDSDIKKLYKEFAPRLLKKYEEFEKDLKKRKEADRKAEASSAKEQIKFEEELARKKQKEAEAEEKRIAKFEESEKKRKEKAKKTASKEIKSSKN